jgi:CDP-diacylglycerol--glycerol-3-phosphate 3-phosphatidyltransferase
VGVPSIYQLKPAFQGVLRPLVRALARGGVTANQVTVLAVALCAAVGIALALVDDQRILLLLPLALFVRMALNAIDGMLAREYAQASRLGAILNELGDVVSDAALYLPLALFLAAPAWLMTLIVIAAIIGEMTGVVAIQIGASRRYDGPFGKSDRAAVFGLLAFLIACGLPQDDWIIPVLALFLVLAIATIIVRARLALAETPRHG